MSRPGPSLPPGGWDGILGTQKRQQQALVPSHWVLGLTWWPPPSSAALYSLFQSCPVPGGRLCGKTGQEGLWERGEGLQLLDLPTDCSVIVQ